ncbi:MAG: hypothetical protein ACXU8U_06305, partial [Asticcacaulis sp.]
GFTTDGAINLKGVVVKSGIEAQEATFDMGLCGVELTTEGGVDFSRVVTADAWIDLTDARIAGILKTGDAEAHLNLRRASVESYDDLGQCWRPESLLLDGFQYGRLEHPTDRGGKTAIYRRRLKWLSRQGTGYSYQSNRWLSVLYSITGSPRIYVEKSRYRPQPFTQLSSVLDAQGFDNDARKVLIAKEWMEARQQRIWPVRWALMLYGVICGFGFSPQRLSFVILVYFLAGWNVIQWCKEHQLLIYDPLPVAAFTDSQHRPVMPFASVNSEGTSPSCKDVDALYYTLNMMSPIDLKLSQNCLISEDLSFTLYDLRPKPLRRLWAFLGQARTGAPDVRQSFLRIRVFELGRWLNFIYPLLGKALVYMYFVLFISRLLRRKSPAAD